MHEPVLLAAARGAAREAAVDPASPPSLADEELAARWVAIAPEDGHGRARFLAETVLSLPEKRQAAQRRRLLALGISRDCPELLERTLRALAARELVRAYRLAALLDDGLLLERETGRGFVAPTAAPAGDHSHDDTGDEHAA